MGDDGKIMILDCVKTKTTCARQGTPTGYQAMWNKIKQTTNNNALIVHKKVAEWNSFCPEPTYVTIRQPNHNMFTRSCEVTSGNKLIYDTNLFLIVQKHRNEHGNMTSFVVYNNVVLVIAVIIVMIIKYPSHRHLRSVCQKFAHETWSLSWQFHW